MAKKNRMSISCEVEDEINFKAMCDVLLGGIRPTINSNHSAELVKLMKRFYKTNKKKLTIEQQSLFYDLKLKYLNSKTENGIY